jgi:hypothetical protein
MLALLLFLTPALTAVTRVWIMALWLAVVQVLLMVRSLLLSSRLLLGLQLEMGRAPKTMLQLLLCLVICNIFTES